MNAMKCFYYKWIVRKTGKVALVNMGWAESFNSIKEKDDSRVIECVEITREEFWALRAQGK